MRAVAASIFLATTVQAAEWYPYNAATWGGINLRCQYGKMQSPIDFETCPSPVDQPAPTITWATQNTSIVNNGHTVQLNPKGSNPGGMSFFIGGLQKTYTLVQCHFHHDSEHTIGGLRTPLEAHCVHQLQEVSSDGAHYGVFGVFFDIDDTHADNASSFLAQFEDELPSRPPARRLSETDVVGFDVFGHPMDGEHSRHLASGSETMLSDPVDYTLLSDSIDTTKFWSYSGSFTTPPCTEAVDFYIMMQVATLSSSQLTNFEDAIGTWGSGSGSGNFRPPQLVNMRSVYGCSATPAPVASLDWYPYRTSNWAARVGAKSNLICAHGTAQSPIDFPPCAEEESNSPISVTWAEQVVEMLNNGHTVQIDAKGTPKGGMTIDTKSYSIVQCHFHYGSEHFVGGVQYPFEVHCVHTDDSAPDEGMLYGVFGQFYTLSETANSWLQKFEDELPSYTSARRLDDDQASATEDEDDSNLDLFGEPMSKRKLAGSSTSSSYAGPLAFQGLYGSNTRTKYWTYEGSFTTPPCTEAVTFYIMMEPAQMTAVQLNKFKDAIGWQSAAGNFRPPQPINSRTIAGCTTVMTGAEIKAAAEWYPYDASNWAGVVTDHHFSCLSGSRQSPVDFPTCPSPMARPEPTITWATQTTDILNNGHTVQINPKAAETGKMAYSISGLTKAYTLVQCHFHHESEHEIAGERTPFEAHCVHTLDGSDSAQRYGVFGVFFETNANENAFLKQFEDELPAAPARRLLESEEAVGFNVFGNPLDDQSRHLASANATTLTNQIDFTKLYDGVALDKYWNYEGSFTTPPCTEAVDFYIFMAKASMTTAQLNKFETKIGRWGVFNTGNFRPPQPLNSRSIYGCSLMPPVVRDLDWYPYSSKVWATAVGQNSNAVCFGGSAQSPIDFASCAVPNSRGAIAVTWESQSVDLINNGHTVQLTPMGATKGGMTVLDKSYTLVQCHFHWGSEHTIGGKQLPFEVHCVHQLDGTEEAPHYGVFGQFYDVGEANSWLANFEDHLVDSPVYGQRSGDRRLRGEDESLNVFGELLSRRKLAGGSSYPTSSWHGPLDFKGLYGSNARINYWNYGGSFTTPPCTEAVDFYIMMDVATLSSAQLGKFKAAIGWTRGGGNFRPPQPLNARVVSGCARVATISDIIADSVENTVPTQVSRMVSNAIDLEFASVLREEQGHHMWYLSVLVAMATMVTVLTLVGLTFAVLTKLGVKAVRQVQFSAIANVDNSTVGKTVEETL